MSTEQLHKFSEELKKTRQKKDITIEQISSKTRIDKKFLIAIEEGDFAVIDSVYIRAFLKEYAQVIEMNVEEVMMKYELAKQGKEEKPAEEIKKDESEGKEDKVFDDRQSEELPPETTPNNNKEKVIIIRISVAVAFILVIISIYFLFIKESSTEIVKEQPFEEIVAEQSQRYEVTESGNEVHSGVTASDSLTLKISTSDTSWVRVLTDGSITKEFILRPNIQKVVKAGYEYDLLIGNSSGIKLYLDDKELPFVGLKGQVRNIIIDKNGIK